MKYNLNKKVLFRTPQFPINAKLEDCWDDLKASIKISSPDFYKIIEHMHFEDIENDSRPVQYTIAKYFNRARFRPTPYGTFASIGIAGLGNPGDILTLNDKMIRHSFLDWREIIEFQDQWSQYSIQDLCFQTNSASYKCGELIRCIYKNGEQFELSDIPYYQVIVDLIEFCTETRSFMEIKARFLADFERESDLKEILVTLIINQLIFTNCQASIIDDLHKLECFPGRLRTYDICQRTSDSGSIYFPYEVELKELITFLSGQFSSSEPEDLIRFKDRFLNQYDQRAIKLLEALDPEMGIGYGDLENYNGDELIDLFTGFESIKEKSPDLSELLKKSQFTKATLPSVIHLEDYKNLKKKEWHKIPNTFNAIVSPAGNGYLVSMLGGASANSILGRFNLVDDEILMLCKDNARIESEANPEVLFFDIAYCGERNVDNINRRRPIYDYQISIHSFSKNTAQIPLNDIYIAVRSAEVILYSKTLKKRLIPRLSSAYTYTRSDLSLFRFLCDIQSQNIKLSLIPNLDTAFEKVDFKPQIRFKNLILSPAGWRIRLEDFPVSNENFKNGVSLNGMYCFVKIGYADQTLHLNSGSVEDLDLIYSILKTKKELWIQESFTQEENLIRDAIGNSYATELVLSVSHNSTIYPGVRLNSYETNVQRTFLPGSEWMYFELFIHPCKANEVLIAQISSVLNQLKGKIQKWFFIRYNESGDHLRLRLQLNDLSDYSMVMEYIQKCFAEIRDRGFLKDLRICIYRRELERYGSNIIDQVEELFCHDSVYVLQVIKNLPDKVTLYLNTVDIMIRVGNSIFGKLELQPVFSKLLSVHNNEHNLNSKAFKTINSFYKKEIRPRQAEISTVSEIEITNAYIAVLRPLARERQIQLFADFFHMHINRLFSDKQREHETIIYNLLMNRIKEIQFKQTSLMEG
ncbi:MAG: thiopeptide-type bacteriocin biosynthesis protein [Sphingobacterium sp.]